MSPLRFPIREDLRDPVDEPALARVWRAIDGRFQGPRRRPGRARPALVVAAALCAVAIFSYFRRHDSGPLRLADGRPVVTVQAPPAGALVALSDGSLIALSEGARLEPLESSSTTFVAVLEAGHASFDVVPGGPRRWRIECGLATVEVLGTRFSCERDPGRLRVAVERGAVLVSGERIANRARRLVGGESLVVEEAAAASAPSPSPSPTAGADADALPVAPATEAFAPPAAPPARAADPAVRRGGTRASVEGLLAIADSARLAGHPAEAEAALQRILAEFAGDPQASLAAFALGRLELDSLGQPRKAAAALGRALALGIPRGLREDVRARLVEAYARAGDRAAARTAAEAYAREFPDGRYVKAIESQLGR